MMIPLTKVKKYTKTNQLLRALGVDYYAVCFTCNCELELDSPSVSCTHNAVSKDGHYTLIYCARCWMEMAGENFVIGEDK